MPQIPSHVQLCIILKGGGCLCDPVRVEDMDALTSQLQAQIRASRFEPIFTIVCQNHIWTDQIAAFYFTDIPSESPQDKLTRHYLKAMELAEEEHRRENKWRSEE